MSKEIKVSISCADDEVPDSLFVAEAKRRILAQITPIQGTEKLSLRSGLNRVLAEEIISPVNVPGHTNSAMDGYALAGTDLPDDEPRDYQLAGTVFAGKPISETCQPGQCMRIMTGAPMPAGTDSVVMQEHTETLDDGAIRIGTGHRSKQNVRLAGEDIASGKAVFKPGRRLSPADIGIMASLGIGEVRVQRRPRVAFFSTGDELRSIGEPLGEGDVYDSNRYTLYGMLTNLGVEVLDLGVVPDNPESLRNTLRSAANMADVVITSGGVSVGDADYIKPILEEEGKINFWKIAMKPGRPLTFGHLDKTLFFGLPGNPVAVMVTFYQFVLPALHYLATGMDYKPIIIQAKSTDDIRKRPGRFEYIRGMLGQDAEGQLSVSLTGKQGSGILTSMSFADCFILLPEDNAGVKAGEMIDVQPFKGLI